MKIMLLFAQDSQDDQRQHFAVIYNKNMTVIDDLYVLLNHPEFLLVCDNCERKLNHSAHIHLVINPNERRDLCFTCFLMIRKDYPNQSYYYVRPNLNLTLAQDGWSILSEIMLLKCLQRFNYGNWKNIKDYMDFYGFNFTMQQIEDHYKTVYLSNNNCISKQTNLQPIFLQYPLQVKNKNHFTFHDSQQTALVREEVQYKIQVFNPERGQYILDFNSQAENLIADLEFLQEDTPEDIEMKLKLLQSYNQQLKQRKKRQQIVSEHKLLTDEYKKNVLGEGKVKNQIRQNFSCFSRFMTYQQSQNILNYMALQYKLSGALNELGRQRKKSIEPTFEKLYESMKKIKQSKIRRASQRQSKILKITGGHLEPKKRKPNMMTVEEMKKTLRQTSKQKDSLKITSLNASLK